MRSNIFLASLVFGIILFSRLIFLGDMPFTANADEASFGYEAYSIHKTGIDSWGEKLPIFFKSYADYKAPALVYSVSALLNFFELSPMVIRLPSAIFSALAAFFAYLIVFHLSGSRALSFFWTLAIFLSTWQLHAGRSYLEASGGMTFLLIQIWGYLVSQSSFSKKSSFATTSGALASYWYPPYFIIALGNLAIYLVSLGQFRKEKLSIFKHLAIYTILTLPIIFNFNTLLTRANQESLKRQTESILLIDNQRRDCLINSSPTTSKICYPLWNKLTVALENRATTFYGMLTPGYYLDNTFLLLSIFYFFGLMAIFFHLSKNRDYRLLLSFLVLAVFVAASPGLISTHRNLLGLVLAGIISAIGFLTLYQVIKHRPFKWFFIVIVFSIMAFQVSQSVVDYFLIHPSRDSYDESHHVRQLFSFIASKGREATIYARGISMGPMFYAQYTRLDPRIYTQTVRYSEPNQFGNLWPIAVGRYQATVLHLDELLCSQDFDPNQTNWYVSEYLKDNDRHLVYGTTDNHKRSFRYAIYDLNSILDSLTPTQRITFCTNE